MAIISKNIVTDFGSDFNAFNTWALANQGNDSIHLDLNAANSYNLDGTQFAKGVKDLTVIGRGATFTGTLFFLGGTGLRNDNAHSARLETVAEGVKTLTLKDISKASLFTVGQYALLGGLDLQGIWNSPQGFPPNLHFFEWVKVTGISGTTITIETATENEYLSTWPLQNSGNSGEVDAGGPATLYALDSSWDCQVEYQNLTVDQPGQTYSVCRKVVYRGVTFTGVDGAVPTQNLSFEQYDCISSDAEMEVDKLIGTVIFNDSTIKTINFQSSSVDTFLMDGSTVTLNLTGTAKSCIVQNSTIAALYPGVTGYGVATGSHRFLNCTISALNVGGYAEKASGDVGVNNVYRMVNGTIIIPRGATVSGAADNGSGKVRLTVSASAGFTTGKYDIIRNVGGTTEANGTHQITVVDGTHIDLPGVAFANAYTSGGTITGGSVAGDAVRFAVPGGYCYFEGQLENEDFVFKVTGIREDVDSIYVDTDSALADFPSVPLTGGKLFIHTLPVPSATFENCTGCPEVVEASLAPAAGKPLFSYIKRTYTESLGVAPPAALPLIFGRIAYCKITVVTPYSGALSLTFKPARFDNWGTIKSDASTYNFAATVNAKIAGERVIAFSGNSGGQSGDTLPTLPEAVWFATAGTPVLSRGVSGEGNGPVIILEVLADQGIVFEEPDPEPEPEVVGSSPAHGSERAPVKHYARLKNVEALTRRAQAMLEPTILPRDFFDRPEPKIKRRRTLAEGL